MQLLSIRSIALFSTVSLATITVLSSGIANAGFEIDGGNKAGAEIVPITVYERPVTKNKKPKLDVYSADQSLKAPLPITIVQPAPVEKIVDVQTWKADAGEPLRDVIRRWSERADVDLVWAVEDRRSVIEHVSFFGSFEGALMELFDHGMQGTVGGELTYFDEDAAQQQVQATSTEEKVENIKVPVAPVDLVKLENPEELKIPEKKNAGSKWKAQNGQTLGEILLNWEEQGDFRLIWDYPIDVTLNHDFFAYGRKEEAVSMLLEQFYDQKSNMQPVGDMYSDPKTGQQYLHIKGNI